MGFDWKLYIQLADELITYQRTASFQEAYLRTAISRSYYGVFCIARNFLTTKGISIPPINTHKFVREQYLSSQDKVERKIGDSLNRLWRRRKDADYEDEATIDINRAKTAYQMALRTMGNLTNVGAI
ncbi:MAG: HEPN domain-containing protein [Candidatus Omnitrophica bacterium]|nr:HEPN domain-containing protein [Candidatus Omnitrophota bacterium]MBM4135740.1 HEPN domain-containing protein [Nitrospira sp.]